MQFLRGTPGCRQEACMRKGVKRRHRIRRPGGFRLKNQEIVKVELHHSAQSRPWRRAKYLAHPNQRGGRKIVPEIVGKITPSEISAHLIEYSRKNLDVVSRELQSVMGTCGAAERLSEELLNFFIKKSGSNGQAK